MGSVNPEWIFSRVFKIICFFQINIDFFVRRRLFALYIWGFIILMWKIFIFGSSIERLWWSTIYFRFCYPSHIFFHFLFMIILPNKIIILLPHSVPLIYKRQPWLFERVHFLLCLLAYKTFLSFYFFSVFDRSHRFNFVTKIIIMWV